MKKSKRVSTPFPDPESPLYRMINSSVQRVLETDALIRQSFEVMSMRAPTSKNALETLSKRSLETRVDASKLDE